MPVGDGRRCAVSQSFECHVSLVSHVYFLGMCLEMVVVMKIEAVELFY